MTFRFPSLPGSLMQCLLNFSVENKKNFINLHLPFSGWVFTEFFWGHPVYFWDHLIHFLIFFFHSWNSHKLNRNNYKLTLPFLSGFLLGTLRVSPSEEVKPHFLLSNWIYKLVIKDPDVILWRTWQVSRDQKSLSFTWFTENTLHLKSLMIKKGLRIWDTFG